MSSSKPASDAALVDVADEIEVAIDKAPGPDHGPGDLDLRLDPSLQPNSPEPAGPGSAQHEGGHESRDAQGLPQPQQAQHIDHAPQGEDRNQDKYVSHDHVAEFNRSESPSASRNGNGNDNGTGFGNGNDIGVGSGNNREQTEQDGLERKGSEGGASRHGHAIPQVSFPPHNSPRIWVLTQALSPLAIRLMRLLLTHGDYVVACLPPQEIDHEDRGAEFRELVNECKSQRRDREGWGARIRIIRCDGRSMGQCSAAVAEAVQVFGRIDILLCCKFEAVVGTVEELSTNSATQNLVRDQFETIFFSQVNFIKAALPQFRAQHTGHIMILTSIGGHIGTPGMPTHTAATWALEGFCDSLAYEIAPFNIKVTIVQPNKEIQSLTNKIILAPQLAWYDSEMNPAPSIRDILTNVLNAHPETAVEPSETEILHRYPKLPAAAVDRLVMETVHALTAIGGHENPPARHIVGFEGAMAVKEKLKTVTEELEDFVEASLAVDLGDSELRSEAREGKAPEPMGESSTSMDYTVP